MAAEAELRERLAELAARFALLAADGLVVLGYALDADGWYGIAAQLPAQPSTSAIVAEPSGGEAAATDAPGVATGSGLLPAAAKAALPNRLRVGDALVRHVQAGRALPGRP